MTLELRKPLEVSGANVTGCTGYSRTAIETPPLMPPSARVSVCRRYMPGPHTWSDSGKKKENARLVAAEIMREDVALITLKPQFVLSKIACCGKPVALGLWDCDADTDCVPVCEAVWERLCDWLHVCVWLGEDDWLGVDDCEAESDCDSVCACEGVPELLAVTVCEVLCVWLEVCE
jgi:hypothetical protein